MLRSGVYGPRLAMLGVVISAVALQACTSAITDAGETPFNPSFALTSGAPVSVAAGGSATTFVKATRSGGLASVITYSITGAPVGLTANIANTSVPDSSTLTVTSSVTLAPGAYTLVVNATADGAAAQHATVIATVTPSAGPPAIAFVATGEHTCALTTAGVAYCWGFNEHGQLGNNESSIVNATPVAVSGGLTFQSIATSKADQFSCGLTLEGAGYCWGTNTEAQIGDGSMTERRIPTRVAGGLTFKSIAVGNVHACGLTTNGTAYCWGSSPNGAFGDGLVGVHLTPTAAAPGLTFDSIVAGTDYTCALTPGGVAYCWGLGFNGQLGNGNNTSSTTPVAVAGGLTFRSLAAGGVAACGLTTAGNAYCWGNDFYGTIGDGFSATTGGSLRRVVPTAVSGGLTFQSISAGFATVCGVTNGGAGYCWGYNVGAVGDGTQDHRATPTLVVGGLTFKSIAVGTGYSCGVTTTKLVYCWGGSGDGELGNGTTDEHDAPAAVRWP